MSIKDWPATERPREKLLARGAAALSDAELLAICLGSGRQGEPAPDLCRRLLREFGSLRGLFRASEHQLCDQPGIGPARYALLQAMLELMRRHLEQELIQGPAMTDIRCCQKYLQSQLREHPFEVFAVLFLDNRHQVLKFEKLFFGTLDCASVHPRVVARKALDYHAAAVILAHNHPAGDPSPSQADRDLTLRLQQALSLLDIRILDHIVIGNGHPFSFAEHDWI